MGMYTEFETHMRLSKETHKEVLEVLKDLVSGNDVADKQYPIKHKFFNCRRWYCVLDFNNCTFDDYIQPYLRILPTGDYELRSSSELKNLDDSIGCFLDFIQPYVLEGYLENGAAARKRYEEFYDSTFFKVTVKGYETFEEDSSDGYGYYYR